MDAPRHDRIYNFIYKLGNTTQFSQTTYAGVRIARQVQCQGEKV